MISHENQQETRAAQAAGLAFVDADEFAALVDAALSDQALRALEATGIGTFIVQHGSYRPADLDERIGSSRALNIDAFAYADDLDARMRKVDLVISHAGSGSILNALRGSPFVDGAQPALPLVIVPNASLMDDHQSELAKELDASGLAVVASANSASLADAIRRASSTTRTAPLAEPRSRLVDLLDELM